jgi:hypothetical protein
MLNVNTSISEHTFTALVVENILQIDAAIMYCTENPFITPLSLSPKCKIYNYFTSKETKDLDDPGL